MNKLIALQYSFIFSAFFTAASSQAQYHKDIGPAPVRYDWMKLDWSMAADQVRETKEVYYMYDKHNPIKILHAPWYEPSGYLRIPAHRAMEPMLYGSTWVSVPSKDLVEEAFAEIDRLRKENKKLIEDYSAFKAQTEKEIATLKKGLEEEVKSLTEALRSMRPKAKQ